MPFNGSGTFTILNLFIPNTTILSSAVNANFTDIATGLSDCLTRDGQAGMTAAFKAISGSLANPSITFTGDLTSGLYLSTTGLVGFVSHSLGMLLNTNIFSATSATVQAGGTNYAVGDTIALTGGTAISQPVAIVATLTGSAVATVTIGYPGFYSTKPSNPVAQGSTSGIGSGCTLNVTYNDPTMSDYRAIFTDQASALIWQKFGASLFMSGLMAKATAYDTLSALAIAGTGITFDTTTSPPTVKAPAVPIQGSFRNLSIKVASNTTVAVAADQVIVSTGTLYLSVVPSSTINLGTNGGVNALDTGTIATNTWYAIWVIAKADGTTACLASTSGTAPTMPTGYIYKARFGWVRTINASATLFGTWQLGRRAQYVVGLAQTTNLPIMASGSVGSVSVPTWSAVSVSTYVPTTASEIQGTLSQTGNATVAMAAPNNSYGAYTSTSNPPPAVVSVPQPGGTGTPVNLPFSFLLESTSVYWASGGASNFIAATGWEDNL